MTNSKGYRISFRIDKHLYETIRLFAKEKGYENISELMREIITFHFMGIMLGYFNSTTYGDLKKEFNEVFLKERSK